MIKILVFSNSPITEEEIKGTGNWSVQFLRALERQAEISEIIVCSHVPKLEKIETKISKNVKYKFIPYAYKTSPVNKILFNFGLRDKYNDSIDAYCKIIWEEKPDIIQIFGLESPFITIIGKINLPIVVHIQGILEPYILKYNKFYKNINYFVLRDFYNIIIGNIPFFHKIHLKKQMKLGKSIYEKLEYVLGRTDWDRRCLKILAPQAKYFLCQELLRPRIFISKWVCHERDSFVFITTITDTFYKNVNIIYSVVKILEDSFPEYNFEWRIAGVTRSDLIPRLMERNGLCSNKIKLLGRIPAELLALELMNGDVFIYPSAIENSSNAIQEAMAVGIPIVATYAGGTDSIINNGETGVLVPEGDPFSLAGAIIELISNKKLCQKFSNESRKIASYRNDEKKVMIQLMSIYKVIIDNESRKTSK